MYIKELSNAEFNSFTDTFEYFSIYQTSEYGFIMNTQNYSSLFLGLIDDERIVAASLILIEKTGMFKYAYAPKGLLVDYNNRPLLEKFTKLLKEYLGKQKVMAIKINPMIIKSAYDANTGLTHFNPSFESQMETLKDLGYYHLGYNNLFESFKPRYDAIIDLNKPIPTLFSSIPKSFQNKIKSADSMGVRIIKGSENELDFLYNQVKSKYPRDRKYFEDVFFFFKKRDMIDYYYAKLDTSIYMKLIKEKYQDQALKCNELNNLLFNNVGKNNDKLITKKIKEENELNELKKELILATKLLKEEPDGIVLAAIIIIKYRDEVFVLMDGYNSEYKKINAKHLLTWKLIEKYANDKYKRFNLGGMTNPTMSIDKYKGLNKFKLSFNARCVEYIGDLELITNAAMYNLYRNSKPLRYILKRDK